MSKQTHRCESGARRSVPCAPKFESSLRSSRLISDPPTPARADAARRVKPRNHYRRANTRTTYATRRRETRETREKRERNANPKRGKRHVRRERPPPTGSDRESARTARRAWQRARDDGGRRDRRDFSGAQPRRASLAPSSFLARALLRVSILRVRAPFFKYASGAMFL